MERPYLHRNTRQFLRTLTAGGIAVMLVAGGCSSGVAPSKTASGAGTGAMVGAVGGSVVGSSTSMGTTTGTLGGAAAGAIVGGIIGLAQEMKDRKEQDRLAQDRAYQQDQAKRRQMEARIKQEADEELAIAQGFQISDYEIADAQKKTDNTAERLKQLREERTAALNRKKMLDELHERQLANEAEIARLEEELQRLRGGTSPTTDGTRPNQANSSEPPAKPGI